MRIVLDTNIFISAFLWRGKPRQVLERVIEGQDELFVSGEILDELGAVLRRPKFGLKEESVQYFIRSLEDVATIVPISSGIGKLNRDSADDKILDCAMAAGAEYLITGDDDLLVLKECGSIAIASASEYMTIVK